MDRFHPANAGSGLTHDENGQSRGCPSNPVPGLTRDLRIHQRPRLKAGAYLHRPTNHAPGLTRDLGIHQRPRLKAGVDPHRPTNPCASFPPVIPAKAGNHG
jgi:hypothetical protein